jgi:hypothetical protein
MAGSEFRDIGSDRFIGVEPWQPVKRKTGDFIGQRTVVAVPQPREAQHGPRVRELQSAALNWD